MKLPPSPPLFRHVQPTALMVCALLVTGLNSVAQTDSFYWNVNEGTWTGAAYSNWLNGNDEVPTAFPSTNGVGSYYLLNGTSDQAAETILIGNSFGNRVMNAFSVGAHNTLYLQGTSATGTAGNIRVNGVFSNAGLIEAGNAATDIARLELYWTSGASVVNSGEIRAAQGLLRLQAGSSGTPLITNTNGLLLAKADATLALQGFTVQGGTLRSEVGGQIKTGDYDVQIKVNLTDVAVDNQGTFRVEHKTAGTNTRTLQTTLNGATGFLNEGLTEIRSSMAGDQNAAAATTYDVRMDVQGTATFDNTGVLRISNNSTRINSNIGVFNQYATFAVASSAEFDSTGTIEVHHESTLADTHSRFVSAKSITNEGTVHVRGNANNLGASFTVTGAGTSYTQSGTGERTLLERGGALSAENVFIESGKLGGVGTVTGATTIGATATLIAGDTLADGAQAGELVFAGNLTFANDSDVTFALGANTAGSGRVSLTGASTLAVGSNVTLNLLDLETIQVGTFRLFDLDSGTITGTFLLGSLPDGWSATLSGGTGTDYLDVILSPASVIPEPSTYALLVGAAGLAMVALRRRRCTN